MARLALLPIDENGRPTSDPLGHYAISDSDDASDPQYYGKVTADGAWHILKISGGNTYRYCEGRYNYTTNWTNRASLGYDYFHIIF